jgi:hypothetical protein
MPLSRSARNIASLMPLKPQRETARIAAKHHFYSLVNPASLDPAGDRDTLVLQPTFENFANRYLAEYAAIRKKPRSVAEDQRNLTLHILPSIGSMKLSEISRPHVTQLHASQNARPVNANRCLSLISHIFIVAEKWGLRPAGTNPCRGIERYRERSRERYLTSGELSRFGKRLKPPAKVTVKRKKQCIF